MKVRLEEASAAATKAQEFAETKEKVALWENRLCDKLMIFVYNVKELKKAMSKLHELESKCADLQGTLEKEKVQLTNSTNGKVHAHDIVAFELLTLTLYGSLTATDWRWEKEV